MPDEFDEDQLEAGEQDQPTESSRPSGIEELPDWAQKDIRKGRKEAQRLRERASRAEEELLRTKFSAKVLAMLPEEVTSFERKLALAQQWTDTIGKADSQTDQETEPVAEEPLTSEEQTLSAVARGTGAGIATSSAKVYDRAEWDLLFEDPSTRQEALRAAQEGRVRLNNKAAYQAVVKDKEELFTISR